MKFCPRKYAPDSHEKIHVQTHCFGKLENFLILFVDNVHFQNSAQMIEVMTEAGVKFEMQVCF